MNSASAAAAACLLAALSARSQSFDELKTLYDYDRNTPLNAREQETASRAGYKLYSIQFDMPKGGQRMGLLVAPDSAGRKPAIVWMHSSGPLQYLGNAALLANAGAVSLLVEAEGIRGESAERTRDALISDVIALRRAADLLEARTDVDPSRMALVGHSYGAMMASVAASNDDRFRAAVFEVGLSGMSIHIGTSPHPWAQGVRKELGKDLPHFLEVISVVDGRLYIGHAPAIPKLFQSAWYDPGVPHKDAQDFFDAASEPKDLKWYDTGHDVDSVAAMVDRARFLGRALHLRNIEKVLSEQTGRR